MKKTTFFLLAALMASVMTGNGLRAQNVYVNVDVHTLDLAALTSATIYAANPGQAYYVDAAHLMPSWGGTGLQATAANVVDTTALSIVYIDGISYISGNVDSAIYGSCFIVATDANNRCYVLGASTRATLDTGYFYAASLLATATDGFFSRTMTSANTLVGLDRPVVTDGMMNAYTSLAGAIAGSGAGAVLNLVDTVNLTAPLTITSPLTVYQQGKPIISTYADAATPLISINGTEVSWFGNATASDLVVPAGSGNIFDVDNGTLILRQFGTVSYGLPIISRNGSNITVAGCSLTSLSGSEVITLMDSSNATISTLNVGSPLFSTFDNNATGTLTVLDSTANATTALIGADAFYRSGNYRKYLRNLTMAVAAANDTVFLARNTTAGTSDTIAKGIVIDLGGNAINGSLYVDNTTDTVYLQNGEVNYLSGTDGATTPLVINGLDSVAILSANNLEVIINDGRFLVINPPTGATVTVNGGKFGQDVTSYLAPRHAIVPNTDADAVSFPYKVGAGFRVTFHNYNARFGQPGYADSIAIVNTADNRIVPAPSRPTYVGADTVFSAYFINPEFTTPWNFLNDVLTSDTTLYAKWYTYNPAVDGRYTVYHYRQALDGTYPMTLCDSAFGIAPFGQDLIIDANVYSGFTPDKMVDTTVNFNQDTIVNFHYVRNNYQITFVLNGGHVGTGIDTVENFLYGADVVYPTVTREGHVHTGWSPSYVTMPSFNVVTYAVYEANSYPVTWSANDSVVTYNSNAVTGITATYVDDNAATVNANVTIYDADGNEVAEARTVGFYTLIATAVDTNYSLTGNVNTLTIMPASVSVTGIAVATAKVYDGTTDAAVTNAGTLNTVYGNDDLTHIVVANYDNPAVGTNKTITANISLMGADAANYLLASPIQVITTSGAIVAPMVFDITQGNTGNGLFVDAAGYCSGDNPTVQYFLAGGSADQYKLVYDAAAHAEGFVDAGWTNIANAGYVDLNIPVDAVYGTYNATLTLRNSAYPQFESAPTPVSFQVNLSRNYVRPIFSDVVGVVDTCNCINLSTVKWYHNGVYVADGPCYQEVGGLTGTYHVTMEMNNTSMMTCEQDDLTTTAPEAASVTATVTTYPNPAVDQVVVAIENSFAESHSIRVMNVMGVTLVNTTFEGKSTTIDFSTYGSGSYTVIVDGIVARVIKY